MTLQSLQIDVPDQYRHRVQIATTVNELIKVRPPYDRTDLEITEGVTPIDYTYAPGNVLRYGRNTTPGTTDMTAVFAIVMALGGDIYVPEGTYLIAGAGADAGGVSITITKNTRVLCHPNAKFTTDSLDNDFFRFTVPSDGSGLPSDGITFEWCGGIFDQTNQKNSTVIPFIADYSASNPGASATCDALSIRGDYEVTGTEFHGIKRAHVEGVTIIAGSHWESAGGDSGVFISGCAQQSVTRCRAVGSRDLGVYASGSTNGTLNCKTRIVDCQFVNCFHGASIKRSSGDCEISNNDAQNCVRGFLVDVVTGNGFNRVRVSGNTGRNCGIPIRLQLTSGYDVSDNHFTTLGALLEDGSTVEDVAGCNGIELYGCKYGIVRHNTVRGLQSGIAAAYPSDYVLLQVEDYATGPVVSEHNLLIGNFGDALRTAGADTGSNNSYIENYVLNAVTSANFSTVGTNYFEVRVDVSTMMRGFSNPVGFADGSVGAPSIARRAGVTTGLRFGANLIGLVASGVDAVRVDANATAGNTRLLVYDVDNATVERVSVGAADSGGAGFKVLRIPN